MGLGNLIFVQNLYWNALIVLFGFIIIVKLVLWLTHRFIIRAVRKSKISTDDWIIQKTRIPLSLLVLLFGIRIALGPLLFNTQLFEPVIKVVLSLIILTITYLVLKVIMLFLKIWGKKWHHQKANDQLLVILEKFLNIVGWLVGFVYVMTIWGVEIGPLLASLGVAGIAVAFALQQSLANVFGGIALYFDGAVKIGDIIELEDNTSGKVIDMGIRSTKIRTWDNEVLILPNGQLANVKIKNIVLPELRVRTQLPFSVAYGSNIEKVKKVVLKELKKVEGFLDDPKPFIRFHDMGTSSLNFRVYFWVETSAHRFFAKDQANTLIYNALKKAKIKIPFPQMDVHMKK